VTKQIRVFQIVERKGLAREHDIGFGVIKMLLILAKRDIPLVTCLM